MARRRAGQLVKAAYRLFRDHIPQWLSIGLFYLPVTIAVDALLQLARLVPFIDAALESEADVGAIGIILAIIIGAAGQLVGLTMVVAGAAFRIQEIQDGREPSVVAVYQAIGQRIVDLLLLALRVLVVVTVLLLSIVGIPWGVRRAIGYTFVAPVAMLEQKRGREVSLVGAVVGLLLLVLLAGLPLWLFSILVTASSALSTPYAAIAITLLYGDARAELEGAERAEPILSAAV